MSQSEAKAPRASRWRALLALLLTLAVGAVIIVAMTWWVIGSAPRAQAVAVAAGITIAEFAALPDDDAYPAALALDAAGTVYTGSYQTGALWSISPAGLVSEIPESRARIGSVTGLTATPAGGLLILDRVTALDAQGAIIWLYADATLESIVKIPADPTIGLRLPDDIAVDGAGNIYISDRDPARVWRYSSAGQNLGIFWQPPAGSKAAPTGLAYDAARQALLITDSAADAVYRVPVNAGDLSQTLAATETLYADEARNGYGFDGITVAPTGEIYIALLAWNRVAQLKDGALLMLARDFRGASDLAYDPARARLYVSNWNQFSLGFGTRPQLPFALDMIALAPAE